MTNSTAFADVGAEPTQTTQAAESIRRRSSVPEVARRITAAPAFQWAVIAIILLGALLVGFESSARFVAEHGELLVVGNLLVQVAFTVELALRSLAHGRDQASFLRDGWNIFDLAIVTLGWLPAVGPLVMLGRLFRLVRVLRLASFSPKLRVILNAVARSLPSLGHVALLIGMLIFVYSVLGVFLFGAAHPETWGSLGDAALNVFQLMTLEGWNELMAPLLESNPWAWIYFLSFIVFGALIIVNLFVAVVLDNMQEAREEQAAEDLLAGAESGDPLAIARHELHVLREHTRRLEMLLDAAIEKQASANPAPGAADQPVRLGGPGSRAG